MGGVRNLVETYTTGGTLFANIAPNTHMVSYLTDEAKLDGVYITEKVDRKTGWQRGTVLRHPAALVQAAKGKVAASVGSIAIGGMVCSSLTLAGVLYPCRARSQVSL